MGHLRKEDADIKIAKFYLLEADYDIEKAKKCYNEDLKIDFSKNARLSQLEKMNENDIRQNLEFQVSTSKVQDSYSAKNRFAAEDMEEEELLIKKNK